MAIAKGTEQLGVGIDSAIMAELRKFVDHRGETIRAVVEMALRRHMANPPPLPEMVPLPPMVAEAPKPKKGKK